MEEDDVDFGPLVLRQKKRKNQQRAVSPMRKETREEPAEKQKRGEVSNLLLQPPPNSNSAAWMITKSAVSVLQHQQQLDIARNEIIQLREQVAKFRELSIKLETKMEEREAELDKNKSQDNSEDGEVDNAAVKVDRAKLSLDIDNFTEFGCGMPEGNHMRYSGPATVRGVPFKIRAFSQISDDVETPGFFLHLFLDSDPLQSGWDGWSSRVEGKMRICPQTEGTAPYVQSFSRLFHAKDKSFGFENFISIETLENSANGWIADDKITVEIEFTANQPHDIESWIALTQALEEERKKSAEQAKALAVYRKRDDEVARAVEAEMAARDKLAEVEAELRAREEEIKAASERDVQQNRDWDMLREQYEKLIEELETSKNNSHSQPPSQQNIDPMFLRRVRERDRQFDELKVHYDQIRARLTLLFPDSSDSSAFPPNAELKLHWFLNIVSYNLELFHQTFGKPVDGQYLLPKHVIAPHSRRIRKQFDEGHIPPEDFANFDDDIIQRLIFFAYTGTIPDAEIDYDLLDAARFFEFGVLCEHCDYILKARKRAHARRQQIHLPPMHIPPPPLNFRVFGEDSMSSSVESAPDECHPKEHQPSENPVLRVNNNALNNSPNCPEAIRKEP